jgi:hypothetical protein
MANKYTDRVLPYLAQLTKSQVERGLITYVVSRTLTLTLVSTSPLQRRRERCGLSQAGRDAAPVHANEPSPPDGERAKDCGVGEEWLNFGRGHAGHGRNSRRNPARIFECEA